MNKYKKLSIVILISSCFIIQLPFVGFFTKDFTFTNSQFSVYLFGLGCLVGVTLVRHCWWKEQRGDKGYKMPRLIGLSGAILTFLLLFILYHSV